MASLPSRTTASFDAIKPVSSLVPLDDELNDIKGATGFLNGGTTGKKLLVKSSDAADPPIEIDQIGAGPLAEWKQNGTLKVSISNAGLFTMANTAVNTGLNADQVDGIEGANIAKLDTALVPFVITYKIDDPSTFGIADNTVLPFVRIPAITGGFLKKITIWYQSGSHTAGGSVTFKPSISGVGDIGSGVSLNDANPTIFTVYTDDFADQAISEGNMLHVVISARSGTVTERNVSINIEGYRKLS
jgi:hypothetical protein